MVATNNNLTDKRHGSQYKFKLFKKKKIHIVTWKRGGNLTSHPKMSKKCSD